MQSNSLVYYLNLLLESTAIDKESAELKRVVQYLNREENIPITLKELRELFYNAQEVQITPKIWRRLENTESNTIKKGQMDKVFNIAKKYGKTNPNKLKDSLQSGDYDRPLIVKFKDRYHLVAGNTRLSTAAAMDINPFVIIAEIPNELEENTTAAVAGYLTPNAFTANPPRKKDIAKQKKLQDQGVGKKVERTYKYTVKLK